MMLGMCRSCFAVSLLFHVVSIVFRLNIQLDLYAIEVKSILNLMLKLIRESNDRQ